MKPCPKCHSTEHTHVEVIDDHPTATRSVKVGCTECPNCGEQIDFHAGHIDNGRVFVCEKGRPLMREVRYHCRHCDSTVIFLKKCEPKGVGCD